MHRFEAVDAAASTILDALAARISVGADGLEVTSPFDGAPALALPSKAEDRTVHVPRVSSYLYGHYYAGDPGLLEPGAIDLLEMLGHRVSDAEFLAQLAAADPHAGYFRSGWQVVGRTVDRLRVRRDGVEIVVDPARHLKAHQRESGTGKVVEVRFPPESTYTSPGYYVTHSNAGPPRAPLVRIYLTLWPDTAVEVTRYVLHALSSLGVAYTYKVLVDPARYRRRDTAVVYLLRDHVGPAVAAVCSARVQVPGGFRDESPAYTKVVTGGIALADEPTQRPNPMNGWTSRTRRSFGQDRSDVIARTICELPGSGRASTPPQIRASLEYGIRAAGLDPERLYLDHPFAGDDHLASAAESYR